MSGVHTCPPPPAPAVHLEDCVQQPRERVFVVTGQEAVVVLGQQAAGRGLRPLELRRDLRQQAGRVALNLVVSCCVFPRCIEVELHGTARHGMAWRAI